MAPVRAAPILVDMILRRLQGPVRRDQGQIGEERFSVILILGHMLDHSVGMEMGREEILGQGESRTSRNAATGNFAPLPPGAIYRIIDASRNSHRHLTERIFAELLQNETIAAGAQFGGSPSMNDAASADGHPARNAINANHPVCVAATVSLVSVIGASPAAFSFENGAGVPGVSLLVGLICLVFTAMSRFAGSAGGSIPTSPRASALGREGLFPRVLSKIHDAHRPPGVAGREPHGLGLWTRGVAPILALAGLTLGLGLAILNRPLLAGSASPIIGFFPWLVAAFGAAGLAYALFRRYRRPVLHTARGPAIAEV